MGWGEAGLWRPLRVGHFDESAPLRLCVHIRMCERVCVCFHTCVYLPGCWHPASDLKTSNCETCVRYWKKKKVFAHMLMWWKCVKCVSICASMWGLQ